MKSILRLLATTPVYAHCDIPCGIYTAEPAQTAAETVARMVELIGQAKKEDEVSYLNSMARYIQVKEEHAQICKEQLLILWTDYFTEEHLKAFPGLHETFWKAAKLCSKNKREVNPQAAAELEKAVDEIAEMFRASKQA